MKQSIFAASSTLLLAVVLCAMPSQAFATTQSQSASTKLPFVGIRYFNFDGGTGTERSITITKNGQATIKLHGMYSIDTIYQGKYQNPLLIKDDGSSYYYQIKGDKIYMLNKDKKLEHGCYPNERENFDDDRCIANLYPE
ncbi:MAG: hypothetical protein Q4C68_06795 [Moraxella sp.]|nr:hypothetical protein [Moraxella sp.]